MSEELKKIEIELPPPFDFSDNLIQTVREWLGEEGVTFFGKLKRKYGTVSAVWMEGHVPHPVHFLEGMQVRNFLRLQDECKNWTDHDFDNQWAYVVERAIED